ncbi:MAG: glycosyltransferase [Pseudomonadota bacterium]
MNAPSLWQTIDAPESEDQLVAQWSANADAPLVSVCCNTYNQQDYIAQCLDSILGQKTSFPFEVLVHDDASSDGTTAIVQSYAERFPRVVRPLIQECNRWSRGHNIAPEFNFPRARGRYIALCDGDDAWADSQKLQQQVDFLEANSDYVLCFTDAVSVDEEGRRQARLAGCRRDLSARELQETASIFTLTTCFRNVIDAWPREFANARYGDLVIWSLLGDHGAGKYLADVRPALYRQNPRGIHSGIDKRHQVERSLETMAALYSYRLRKGDRTLAYSHLQHMVIHNLRLLGVGGLWTLFWRGVKRSADVQRR